MTMNQQVLIDSLPQGKLAAGNYRLAEAPMPEPGYDEVLVRTTAFAITAGTRAGLQGSASYAGAPRAGVVMNGTGVGEVVGGGHDTFPEGTRVLAPTGWQAFSAQKTRDLTPIPDDHDPLHYLGPLGVNGLTAYFGLLDVGHPRGNDTVMVSAAAGSVGHIVGQIARIRGCRWWAFAAAMPRLPC